MLLKGIKKECVDVEVSKEELMKAVYDNIDFKELVSILSTKFIYSVDKSAEFIENNNLMYWEEHYHGSDTKRVIRKLTENEYKIHVGILELNSLLGN